METEFAFMPLGPVNGGCGRRWCCGLYCTGREPGTPCPYGLIMKPKGKRQGNEAGKENPER
ncbi:MAG TPA: hypothetical protein VEM32_01845 [Geobacteraceae bacterium]|nr:hypothetical protein [Geobacteraceae bacterium]